MKKLLICSLLTLLTQVVNGQEPPKKYILPATPQDDDGEIDPRVSADVYTEARIAKENAKIPVPNAPPKEIIPSQLQARRELGRYLFFDKSTLSLQGTMSCADCHIPDKRFGYGDGRAVAVGAIGQTGTGRGLLGIRNSKSLFNLFEREKDALNWDGRVQSIFNCCFQAVDDPLVLNLPTVGTMVARAQRVQRYQELAALGYPSPGIDEGRLRDSMVHFLKTIRYEDLPADRIAIGMQTELPPSAVRGWHVFENHCIVCHDPAKGWQDYQFHNIGISARSQSQDIGRGAITQNANDNFKFRTPDLRGMPHSPPYMHDGSLKTIEEVVGYFAHGGKYQLGNQILQANNIDPLVAVIELSPTDERALVSFLRYGFQGENYPEVENPFKPTVAAQ